MSMNASTAAPGSRGVPAARAPRNFRATASSCRTLPQVNERRNDPSVDGARMPPNTSAMAPCRSTSMSSMLSAPAAMPATRQGIFRPGFTPVRLVIWTCSRTRSARPHRWARAMTGTRPARDAQGSPVSTIFHGLPVFEVVNLFGYDAGTLGNHDFDYGWMQARKFIEIANYPIVSSNVVGAEGQLFTPKPYVIVNVNGLRVAVIGAMTDELKTLTTPKSMEQWHTTPVLATARKLAPEQIGRASWRE